MILTVHRHTDKNELICQTDDGARITVDPFVGCAAHYDDAASMIGKTFVMRDFWQTKDGVYLCHEFIEHPDQEGK